MENKIKSILQEEYDGFIFYVKNNSVRCIRSGIESIIMCTLMVSWIFYILKPFLDDVNNYGITTTHYDPIAVIGIIGFVFLSFFFLMTWGWYRLNKSLKFAFRKYEKPEQHYKSEVKPQ